MPISRVDQLYRRLLLTKFFTKGWGNPNNLKRIFDFRKILSNRETCQQLVAKDHPIFIDKEYKDGDCKILEGHFSSPFIQHLPGVMPKEVEIARFQAILPLQWKHPQHKPVCIHLAGTGDHFFWRRRLITAKPLIKEAGMASILLENPYYGSRKPKKQMRSSLHNVSDLFVMGGALILESMALLYWCERNGWGPLGISGISMGGHMASLAATNWNKPISLIPCLSWSTASCVFTQGVLSGAIPWETLQEQFFENSIYQEEISKLIVSPEKDRKKAYDMGLEFVKTYSSNMEQTEEQHKQQKQYSVSHSSSPSSDAKQSPHLSQSSDNSKLDLKSFKDSNVFDASLSKEKLISGNVSVFPKSFIEEENSSSTTASSSDSIIASTSLPPSGSSPSNKEEKQTKLNQKPSRMGIPPLTLNYAMTKQSQQVSVRSKTDNSALTLSHAMAKSKLAINRRSRLDSEQIKNLKEEALDFMKGAMDECTHLANFSVPVDPELVIIVAAKQDAYIPRDGVLALDQLWPGSEVRYIDQGHIGAVLFNQRAFRKAVVDAFDKQMKKYYSDQSQESAQKLRLGLSPDKQDNPKL